MISEAQKQSLKVLGRDVGYEVTVTVAEIRLSDDHGDTVFVNDETGYFGASVMLRSLKAARNRVEGDLD